MAIIVNYQSQISQRGRLMFAEQGFIGRESTRRRPGQRSEQKDRPLKSQEWPGPSVFRKPWRESERT